MHDTIIVRYAEIALKGKNRGDFEKRLVTNISETLKNCGISYDGIFRKRGRIFIRTTQPADQLSFVFGISSFSYAVCTQYTSIIETVDKVIEGKAFETFRVSAKRLDHSIQHSSADINIEVGRHIQTKYDKRVNLKDHDLDVGIEIIDCQVYVFAGKVEAPGGLPLGSTGKVLVLLDMPEAVLAGLLMMKRGCKAVFAKPAGISFDVDLDRIMKYNNHEQVKICGYGSEGEVAAIMKKTKADAIVVGYTSADLARLANIRTDSLVLAPLVGLKSVKNIYDMDIGV